MLYESWPLCWWTSQGEQVQEQAECEQRDRSTIWGKKKIITIFVWFSAYLTSSHGAKTSPFNSLNSAPKDGASGSSDIADILDKEYRSGIRYIFRLTRLVESGTSQRVRELSPLACLGARLACLAWLSCMLTSLFLAWLCGLGGRVALCVFVAVKWFGDGL